SEIVERARREREALLATAQPAPRDRRKEPVVRIDRLELPPSRLGDVAYERTECGRRRRDQRRAAEREPRRVETGEVARARRFEIALDADELTREQEIRPHLRLHRRPEQPR